MSAAVLLIRDDAPVGPQLDLAADKLAQVRHRLVMATRSGATALDAVRTGRAAVVLMLRPGHSTGEDRFAQLVALVGGRVEFLVRPAGGQVLHIATSRGRGA